MMIGPLRNCFITLFLIAFSLPHVSAAYLYNPQTKEVLSLEELEKNLPNRVHLVLGEFHNNLPIQKAQQKIIEATLRPRPWASFSLAWEFLDYPNQDEISNAAADYKTGLIDRNELVLKLFPAGNPKEYAFPLSTIKGFNGALLGIGAPREWRRKVRLTGLSSLLPEQIPPNMQWGNQDYRERFYAVMGGGGHLSNDDLIGYWHAQSYSDSVMAYQTESNAAQEINITIIGSFHTDYHDGYIDQLKKITSREIITIKVVNALELDLNSIAFLKSIDPKYGAFADYIYFAD